MTAIRNIERSTSFEPHSLESKHSGERIVVTIEMEYGGLVLLGAGGDKQIWDR